MLLCHDFVMYPYLDPRVYKEAKSLVKKGYEVSIISWHNLGKDLPASEEYEGIKVYRILQKVPYYTTSLLLRFPFYLLYVLRSVRRAMKLKPDIIHCHDLDTLIIGVILKLLTGKPLYFDAHEDFPGMLEVTNSIILSRLARLYEKILIKMADKVIAAEMPYTDVMKKHYGITPAVVMNLPNLASFHPGVDPSPVIRKYGLEGKVVISHIGGIGKGRGIHETLEALPYLQNDDIRYLLIGSSTVEELDRIKEIIIRLNLEGKVVLTGGVDYKDTPMYYKASDISMVLLYPVPNYVTSLPTKLFESLAVGTPVLAGNLEYLGGVVKKYDVGLCADSKDPGDIAAKLNTLISDRQMRIRMGQNGLKAIREEFNWGESEKRLLEIYEGVLPHE